MIGIIEIIFAIIMFSLIWFIIFKVKLKIDEKDKTQNIKEKLEKQEIKQKDLLEQLKKNNYKEETAPPSIFNGIKETLTKLIKAIKKRFGLLK